MYIHAYQLTARFARPPLSTLSSSRALSPLSPSLTHSLTLPPYTPLKTLFFSPFLFFFRFFPTLFLIYFIPNRAFSLSVPEFRYPLTKRSSVPVLFYFESMLPPSGDPIPPPANNPPQDHSDD